MATNLSSFIKKHRVCGLDSMLFIYQFEKYSHFWPQTNLIFDLLEKGKFRGVTSAIALIEILTLPKKEKNFYLVKEYKELITTFPHLTIQDVDLEVADLASSLRAKYNLATPDAILIASALKAKANGFITADERLKKVKEIEVLVVK